MEAIVYGNLKSEGIEVVSREGRHFVRYDAGAHVVAWREDEVTPQEFAAIAQGGASEHQAILAVQRRLELSGVDPYRQNWTPPA